MDKLIRRGALIKNLENSGIVDSEDDAWVYSFVIAAIEETPTVDAVPVVHAEWIIAHEGIERNLNTWQHVVKRKYSCNICDYHTGNQGKYFNFCPNCGAKMDGKKVEE